MWDNPSWLLFDVSFHLKQMLKNHFSLHPFPKPVRLASLLFHRSNDSPLLFFPETSNYLFSLRYVLSLDTQNKHTHASCSVVRFLIIVFLFLFSCVCMCASCVWHRRKCHQVVYYTKNFVVLRFVSGEHLCWQFLISIFPAKCCKFCPIFPFS